MCLLTLSSSSVEFGKEILRSSALESVARAIKTGVFLFFFFLRITKENKETKRLPHKPRAVERHKSLNFRCSWLSSTQTDLVCYRWIVYVDVVREEIHRLVNTVIELSRQKWPQG